MRLRKLVNTTSTMESGAAESGTQQERSGMHRMWRELMSCFIGRVRRDLQEAKNQATRLEVLPKGAREEWAWDSGEWLSHLRVGIGHYWPMPTKARLCARYIEIRKLHLGWGVPFPHLADWKPEAQKDSHSVVSQLEHRAGIYTQMSWALWPSHLIPSHWQSSARR